MIAKKYVTQLQNQCNGPKTFQDFTTTREIQCNFPDMGCGWITKEYMIEHKTLITIKATGYMDLAKKKDGNKLTVNTC